ncbi:hypothetical protein DL96DRAFT_1608569 [Flagelloscypha sp. PMI_526]|nr:hypothetical protein DL96DRAFT_1608569 [Flagelloscypha sp. PMI_526]
MPHFGKPPTYPPPKTAPSGSRITVFREQEDFPDLEKLGPPPCTDLGGEPLFFSSGFLDLSIHPGKAGAHIGGLIPYGGEEQNTARYEVLPYDPKTMELVPTSHGAIPEGRRPVEGGYEESGAKLYHSVAEHDGYMMPGKTGVHLGGTSVSFGGGEHWHEEGYAILCWKDNS